MRYLLLSICLLFPLAGHAQTEPGDPDLISLELGYWSYRADGEISDDDADAFAESSARVNFDDGDDVFYELTVRPPITWLPNFSLRYINLQGGGRSRTSIPGTFGGIFGAIGNIAGGTGNSNRFELDYDIDDWELTAVYPFRIYPKLELQAGISVKQFKGEFEARRQNSEDIERRSVDSTLPFLVGGFIYRPRPWLGIQGSVRGLPADGDTASEYKVGLNLQPWRWLSVSAGYWRKAYDLEDDPTNADLNYEGPYLSVISGR